MTVLPISTAPIPFDSDNEIVGTKRAWVPWLATVFFFAWLAIIWCWPVSIYTLTVDDSYYYLKTAANAQAGHGFSFDRKNPTNGFHPLWMGMLVPLAEVNYLVAGDSMETFARLAMTLQLVMIYLGVYILAKALGDRAGWLLLATGVLLVNFYFAKILINALESGAQWLCICATLAVMLRILKRGLTNSSNGLLFALGILAGLTVLSRLTAVLFACAVLLTVLLVAWQADGKRDIGLLIGRLLVASLGVAVVVAPYLASNYFTTGHLLSVSAAVKTSREFTRSGLHWIAALSLAIVWFGSLVVLWRSGKFKPFSRLVVWVAFPLMTYAVLQSESDMLLRGVLTNVEIWYMVPQALLAAVAVAWVFHRAGANWKSWRWPVVAGAALLAAFAAVTWHYRLDPTSYAGYLASRHTADWLKANTPADAVAAGWDVGVVGGFADRPVMNLDALINSWDYKLNYFDKHLTSDFITKKCPADYIAQYFWDDQFTPEKMANYRDVDFSKWNVVFDEPVTVRSISNSGKPRECYYLVLTRRNDGKPLLEYLQHQKSASTSEAAR